MVGSGQVFDAGQRVAGGVATTMESGFEIDGHTRIRTAMVCRVVAVADDQGVGAGVARQNVVARAADEDIHALATVKKVGAALATVEKVGAALAHDLVVAFTAGDGVGAFEAGNDILEAVTGERVVSRQDLAEKTAGILGNAEVLERAPLHAEVWQGKERNPVFDLGNARDGAAQERAVPIIRKTVAGQLADIISAAGIKLNLCWAYRIAFVV